MTTAPLPESDDPGSTGPANPREKRMGFLEHLEELRWTILKCAVTFAIVVTLIAIFMKEFAFLLSWPLEQVKGDYPQLASQLVTTSPMAVFSVIIQICGLGGFVVSLPFFLYFIGRFIAPALTDREMKLLLPTAAAAAGLFLFGAAFSYLLLVPSTIRVSMQLNDMFGFQMLWTAERYYWLVVVLVLGMGAAFEFPLLLVLLVRLEMVDVARLRRWRKLMILGFFIVAAVVTPTPDPFNQAIVALTMYLLYEISIVIAARVERRRRAPPAG